MKLRALTPRPHNLAPRLAPAPQPISEKRQILPVVSLAQGRDNGKKGVPGMRVSSDSAQQPPAKVSKKKLTKAEEEEAEKKAGGKKTGKTEPAKAESKTEPKDEVRLSAKAKDANPSDRDLTEAETLMDHVNSGKLSQGEQDLAMKRVGDILKKYGRS